MKINKRIFIDILPIAYLIFAFLSIHNINNIYFYIFSSFATLCFLCKKQLKLSFSIFATMILLMPLWLFYNNIFYEKILNYSLLSDVLTSFSLALIFTFINSKQITLNKEKTICIIMPIFAICFYKYYAYENLVYWTSILIMITCGYKIFETEYAKFEKPKILIIMFLTYIIVLSYFIFDNLKINNTSKIAVLKSNWCDVSNIPNNASHEMDYYYAYSDFMNILKSYGDVEVITNKNIIEKNINYNVIILITPTEPINEKEVLRLSQFVNNGGRLILITDHTNLYGHLDAVQGLLSSFKVKMNDDALFNPKDYYAKAFLNTNSLSLNEIIMKTGGSIIPPFNAKVWAITKRIVSEKADYTKQNFFGSIQYSSDDSVGNFPIGITIKSGKGDFVIWNDSTIFSNFAISQKDNKKLLDYIVKNKIYTKSDNINIYKFMDIYSYANNTFLEAPPRHLPDDTHFSTLVANFTRYKLFPNFINKQNSSALIFTDYENFKNKFATISAKNIVITSAIPEVNIFGAKKYWFDNVKEQNNFCYSTDGENISTKYENKNILFAKNVLSDNELGTWWNTTMISPYKLEMINEFFNWLKYGNEIKIYRYPNIKCIKKGYLIKYDNNTEEYIQQFCKSDIINVGNEKIVYIGNRNWVFVVDKNIYLGNPELSDNQIENFGRKYTIKIAENKNNLVEQEKSTGCLLNKFKIGIKHPVP